MLEQLLPRRIATDVTGDGAGDMVDAVATRDEEGRTSIVAWNATVDVAQGRRRSAARSHNLGRVNPRRAQVR
jgi:hypothetical protein